ncbi:MAG: ATP-binding protein [Pseudomonadota bacterium]
MTRIILGDNPWLENDELWEQSLVKNLPETYIPRTMEKGLASEGLRPSRAALVVGPRQSGKSTLLWHLGRARKLRLLLVNCEEKAVRELAASPAVFLREMESFISRSSSIFLEEVQHLDDAGLFIKGLVDRKPGVPILVTGSSGYDMRSRTRESLAGRAARFRLLPLSLREAGGHLMDLPGPARALRMEEAWRAMTVSGGYPEVWTSGSSDTKELLLSRLVESFLIRDASDLYRIARPDAFRKVIKLLAGQTGNLVNMSEYASICSVSADTVASYTGILEDAHVICLLRPFVGGKRAEVKLHPKAYYIDCGLRNAVLGMFGKWEARPDKGPLLETWVFGELLKSSAPRSELFYWRSKSGAEVDFVVQSGGGLAGIEVKAEAMRRPKISRSSRSFIEAYRPADFYVVNTNLEHAERLGGTTVHWVRPHTMDFEAISTAG